MGPVEVKAESERMILALGGRICDWLPYLDRTEPRASSEVADRALVLHAMLQIYFGAPIDVIPSWIKANQLEFSLSRHERSLLTNGSVTEQETINFYWYIEALWAMVWAGQLTDDLAIDQHVGSNLASLLPNLQVNEDGSGFRRRFMLRPFEEVYRKLDLYYRAHWYARDGQLNNYSTEPFTWTLSWRDGEHWNGLAIVNSPIGKRHLIAPRRRTSLQRTGVITPNKKS